MASIWDPPFMEAYKNLLEKKEDMRNNNEVVVVEECELPVIDLSLLEASEELAREECKSQIARASEEWGFFQVVKHGISGDILKRLRWQQEKAFKEPFDVKAKEDNFSAGAYRWGSPTATCIKQLSWSEAFHIPLTDIIGSNNIPSNTLRSTMEQFASRVSRLADRIAEILAEKMGDKSSFMKENCLPDTCYLRLNRYPACPVRCGHEINGLITHTDSDFLTILYQDHEVGGLQLVKDGKWIAVKPNPEALIVNIGDLFQAYSNGLYKSVQHRVVANPTSERFSTAYFFCPSNDTVIDSCRKPSLYRKFNFREYRQQVRDDVRTLGSKIGLPRFLVTHHYHQP
ncbi:hypothetical protein HN51_007485 [Arachis hypogaea]|uniref:Gibberellin 2-beta-dioxygenase 8-like n=1 Tax=Arachis duranensis TaxID=130453 RepID=A0A6P4DAA0_ARADU|nr:gibberellin 2-beta-dioxygenase 8-like [Arachis duranensis]XP_029154154.1 gibberellin 2-beta-dioxygenase 8-like [Arachis hypogaea]XP_029154155.1 gibberellin 2-beta-dioxygenase 8-like [Arachis hypogaea]XP_029154156.1 gibberellin 2-beta-dioxygenase 8-like [Arachis hypogaea]QHO41635.1 Gibberellin 2-beta-dioxygenase [Arachis hypogaea]